PTGRDFRGTPQSSPTSRRPSVCMTRRPPGCPLFPSPTLFRSLGGRTDAHAGGSALDRSCPLLGDNAIRDAGGVRPSPPGCAGQLDRKSTRLNSSHVKISYAVFCLKKKTTTGWRACSAVSGRGG